MDLDRTTLADRINAFMRLCLDVHGGSINAEQSREMIDDLIPPRAELGPFQDERGIEVAEGDAALGHPIDGIGEEVGRVAVVVVGVVVWEKLADVGLAEGTEDGIGDGVEQGVAVGMADRAVIVLKPDAADDERATRRIKAVEVIAVTDTEARRIGRCWTHGGIVPIPYEHRGGPERTGLGLPVDGRHGGAGVGVG